MQLKYITFMLPFITLSLEVVSGYLIHEDAETNLEFLLRIDANKDEKLSYKELVDAKIEEVTLKIINLILDFPNHKFFYRTKMKSQNIYDFKKMTK